MKTTINDIQIQDQLFIDGLHIIVDSLFSNVEADSRIKIEFKDAYMTLISERGTPWASVLSEHVHTAEVADLTRRFTGEHGRGFMPQGMELADYQLMSTIAGLLHDVVWLIKTSEAPDDFFGLDIGGKLLSLQGSISGDEVSAQIAGDIMKQISSAYAPYVENMVKYHGSGLREREQGIKGIEYILPLCFADCTDRVRDRYAILALGTQIINLSGKALHAIQEKDDPKKHIKKVTHEEFIPVYMGEQSVDLMHTLGPGYKQLPLKTTLTEEAKDFLLKVVKSPYLQGTPSAEACTAILKTAQKEVSGQNGTFAQINECLGDKGHDVNLNTNLPNLYKREQK